jgi:hypothetical protein
MGEVESVSVYIDNEHPGYEILRSTDCLVGNWKWCGSYHNLKDAKARFEQLVANNIGRKRKYYYKLIKVCKSSWLDQMTFDFGFHTVCKKGE